MNSNFSGQEYLISMQIAGFAMVNLIYRMINRSSFGYLYIRIGAAYLELQRLTVLSSQPCVLESEAPYFLSIQPSPPYSENTIADLFLGKWRSSVVLLLKS